MPNPAPNLSHPEPGPSRLIAGLLVWAIFTGLWLVFAGIADPTSWIVGLPAIAAATWAFVARRRTGAQTRLSPLALLRLIPVFLIDSFRGGFDVTRRVLGLGLDVDPGLTDYRLRLRTPASRVLFIDLVSLLPGTFSADLDGDRLRVHALSLSTYSRAELERLEQRVGACFGEMLPHQAEVLR